jgi:CRISPR-associated protein Csd2
MNIPDTITDPGKRYDFLILFDVTDGNPNGDPDAGNLPRVDPETLQGIVTDVCLKRKIRNYVDLSGQGGEHDAGIFVRDSGIALNTKIREAAEAIGATKDKKVKNKDSRAEMCRRYYDIRMFGGVLSTGDYNSGQVRGPMQLTFSRSIDPIVPVEMAITRVAITKEGENKETEIGRKASVPYGLYKGKGFFSPMLAKDTGVSSDDLKLFWTALANMFENDRSASRGDMQIREVAIFVHDNPLGNAPSGKLFERLKAEKNVKAPREIGHYDVTVDDQGVPEGVTLVRLLK